MIDGICDMICDYAMVQGAPIIFFAIDGDGLLGISMLKSIRRNFNITHQYQYY